MLSNCDNFETRSGLHNISPKKWKFLPALSRVTNYTAKEVQDSIRIHGNLTSSSINTSRYEVTLSQKEDGDGFEDYGIPWNDESNLGSMEIGNSDDNVASFISRLESGCSNDVPNNRDARKSNLRNEFHTLLNTIDCGDPVIYNVVLKSIQKITSEARKYNEDINAVVEKRDDGKSYFPNSSLVIMHGIW